MAAGLGEGPELAPETRVFTRSWSSRLLALGVFVGTSLLLAVFATGPDRTAVPLATWVVLGALAAASGALLVPNFLDRIEAGPEGVVVRNGVLDRLRPPRRLLWSDVERLREHRGRALFVTESGGRRHVFDSLADYEDFRDRVSAATGLHPGPPTGPGDRPAPPGRGAVPPPSFRDDAD